MQEWIVTYLIGAPIEMINLQGTMLQAKHLYTFVSTGATQYRDKFQVKNKASI